MSKKNLKKTAALMLGLALTVGATGCNFVVTDSARDLKQTVATVDISAALKENADFGNDIAKAVSDILGKSEISKRDLVTAFLSSGSSAAQSYGYEATFNMLLDNLIQYEMIMQYATAWYLKKDNGLTKAGHDAYVQQTLAETKEKDAKKTELLKAHPEVLTLQYFLTEGGKNTEKYDRAVYSLKKSLNDSLDSLEKQYIKANDHEHDETEPRTLPTGVGTEKEDYYSKNYEVYTGRNDLAKCGTYEAQDGSTTVSRRTAYNSLLSNLHSYGLISTTAGKVENPSDIEHMDYYYLELSSVLTQAFINKYYEDFEKEVEDKMDATYVQGKYNALLTEQRLAYEDDAEAFKTKMDGVTDSTFLLHGLKDFGYVYNIVLPLSTMQEIEYAEYKDQGLKANDLLVKRAEVWANIKADDQRSTWISSDTHTNYSYEVGDKYYFFEDHFSADKAEQYETIRHYAGQYPFQGTITKDEDGEITKINKKTGKDVDGVLEDMLGLIKTVSGLESEELTETNYLGSGKTKYAYYKDTQDYTEKVEKTDKDGNPYMHDTGEVEDYSRFIYRQGKLQFPEGQAPKAGDFFNPNSLSYKALSAVNEMVFAYSSDGGSMNANMGYVVSPDGNGYVPEFEEAAQWAVANGVGSWAVVPTDYGWHIIYCSLAYDGGEVYTYNHAEAVGDTAVEGSFSKLFYDALKTQMVSGTSSETQALVLNQFNNDKAVKKFEKVYRDLWQA